MSQEILNKLVGVHLGKAGDGSAVKPYVTFFCIVVVAV
jgi:hypothetical protein